MDKEKLDELAQTIEDTFTQGGSHAHNVITYSLQDMAKHDRKRADEIYADLLERGF